MNNILAIHICHRKVSTFLSVETSIGVFLTASSESATHTCTSRYDAMKRTNTSHQRVPKHTQHKNTDCLVKQHSDRNVHNTFIMLILIRKMIKLQNYVRNESKIALFEGQLLNTTESIFNTQI